MLMRISEDPDQLACQLKPADPVLHFFQKEGIES